MSIHSDIEIEDSEDILISSQKKRFSFVVGIIVLSFMLVNLAIYLVLGKNMSGNFSLFPTNKAASGKALASTANGIGGGNINGNCTAGKRNLPIYNVDIPSKITSQDGDDNAFSSDKKYISISFDAAWGATDTISILDILDKYNVKTTFFMTGEWVESYPDMVKEIYSRGHDLGNHSMNHKHMSKLSVEEQKVEIMQVYDKIKELTGYESFLFRPPYGDYDSTLITTSYSCNFYPIQWSVDSLDWKDYGVDSIIKTVTQHKALDNGAIILLHNGSKFTEQALDTLISTLQSQGYTIVPISELIIRQNFHMNANGTQVAD
ncbi:MAG: polysaccharide deacetylase family protein [Lachnospira sp.]